MVRQTGNASTRAGSLFGTSESGETLCDRSANFRYFTTKIAIFILEGVGKCLSKVRMCTSEL